MQMHHMHQEHIIWAKKRRTKVRMTEGESKTAIHHAEDEYTTHRSRSSSLSKAGKPGQGDEYAHII